MPMLKRPDGQIYYEEFRRRFSDPAVAAPGGLAVAAGDVAPSGERTDETVMVRLD